MGALRIERDDDLLRVTLARPETRNAFDADLIGELAEAFVDVGKSRAVLLAGDGPSFCAGADVEWMRASVELDFDANVADANALRGMLEAIDRCPAPVVARIQGHALGGGAGLVACADIAVADQKAVFAFSEVKLGIIPAVISPFALAKIGPSWARRYFVTGERFDAATALRIGLVHEVDADLDAAVERVLAELRSAGPRAARHAKRLVLDRPDGPETARRIAERRTSAEGQEGLRAFLERRSPDWSQRGWTVIAPPATDRRRQPEARRPPCGHGDREAPVGPCPDALDRRPRAPVHLPLEPHFPKPADEAAQLHRPGRERAGQRRIEIEDADVEPSRAELERAAEVLRLDLPHAAAELQPHVCHPARRAAVDEEVAHGPDAQLLRDLGRSEPERPPAVVLRERVVRVGDRDEIRHRVRARPRLRDRDCAAARGRVVEGRRDAAVPEEHLAGGRADRPVGRRLLGADAAVDLAARVGVEVEERPRLQRRERVGARDDRLRTQRLGMPVVRHLPRDDPAQVAVERQAIDDRQLAAALVDEQRAAIRVGAEPERRRAGDEPQRRAQLCELRGDDVLRPRPELPHLAAARRRP